MHIKEENNRRKNVRHVICISFWSIL